MSTPEHQRERVVGGPSAARDGKPAPAPGRESRPGEPRIRELHQLGRVPRDPRAQQGKCRPQGDWFCPFQALDGAASLEFSEENRRLLLRRLRIGSWVLFLGVLAFLVRPLLYQDDFYRSWPILGADIAVASVLGVIALALRLGWNPRVIGLRAVETLVFGLPAAFLVWVEIYRGQAGLLATKSEARLCVAEMGVLWVLLMQLYGVFVPNTLRRAVAVILSMATVPIVMSWALGAIYPAMAEVVADGGVLTLALWLAFGAVASIYSSHRFVMLRRQAYEARRLGSYTLSKRLGGGGMGDVYLAEHRFLKRPCAVKLIRPEFSQDPATMARFETEVQSAARLTHPNTIEIYDYGRAEDGAFYYAMEYLPGMSLQQIVDRYGPMPPERVVHLLRPICGALREAHEGGLVHRDIKPGNIYAACIGGMPDFAKLLDFGLVKSLHRRDSGTQMTIVGTFVGSPLYSPPESALEGNIDPRGDIYSLGATAYFCLTGRAVFPGENPIKVLFAHANEQPTPPAAVRPGIPRDLEAVVLKCLAKNPADRFAAAADLETALRACESSDSWTPSRAAAWWDAIAGDEETEPRQQETAKTVSLSVEG
jgi:serine/threonine-protein kinase